MFWGCFSWWGIGPLVEVDGNMNSEGYIDILAKYFVPWARSLAENHPYEPQLVFQQDLASVHTSQYSTWWMETHDFKILEWASHSPDLNPIENLWEHLDSALRKQKSIPIKKEELINAIRDEWNNLSQEYLRTLISSMPNRVKSIIRVKGWHTKY